MKKVSKKSHRVDLTGWMPCLFSYCFVCFRFLFFFSDFFSSFLFLVSFLFVSLVGVVSSLVGVVSSIVAVSFVVVVSSYVGYVVYLGMG